MTFGEKTSIGRLSQVSMDGPTLVVPGMENKAYQADQLPFIISSPLLTLVTQGLANQGSFMVPFNAKIVRVMVSIETPVTATAPLLNIGTKADEDHFLDAYTLRSIATSTGLHTLSTATTFFVNDQIDAGDIVEFDADAADDAKTLVFAV